MKILPQIALTNVSTVLTDEDVLRIGKALGKQVKYHFEPHWNAGCTIIPQIFTKDSIPAGCWELAFLEDSDQAGALGYHDFKPGPGAEPVMKVFAGTDHHYGLSPSVTASHELLEALGDPYVDNVIQTSADMFHALEVGDPVEADDLGYWVNLSDGSSIQVSDFILPAWFWVGTTGFQYDYCSHLTSPLQLAKGGYCSYWRGGAWHQKTDFAGTQQLVGAADMLRPRPSQDMRYAYAEIMKGI